MTDTSSFLPNSIGISSDCLYNLKPSAVASRQYRCSVPTSNKSNFNPGDVAIAYIPARRNCVLDCANSYIRYTVKNLDPSNNIIFDNNGASVINRLDVFHGSNLLETVQQYNVLYSYLVDFQLDTAKRNGLSAMYGTSPAVTALAASRQGLTISPNNLLTVCMPVLSGSVGCLADKMLPLNLADDIRLEFTIEQATTGMVYAGTQPTKAAWQIINMELELSIIELSETAMNMVQSVSPFSQPIYLHASSYRHYVSSLPAASSGGVSFLVPARFASLKSLIALPRRNTEMISSLAYSLCSRVNPNLAQYWWRIGSLIVPQKSVNLINSNSTGGYAEAFAEIQKSFHSLNHMEFAGSVGTVAYNVADVADTTIGDGGTLSGVLVGAAGSGSYANGFAIAQELETYAQRNDVMLSGINTLGSQVFFEANINTAISTSGYTFDFYAFHDIILVLQDGLLSAKF